MQSNQEITTNNNFAGGNLSINQGSGTISNLINNYNLHSRPLSLLAGGCGVIGIGFFACKYGYRSYSYLYNIPNSSRFPCEVEGSIVRQKELDSVKDILNQQMKQGSKIKKLAITGLTGTGKSELARSYAKYYQNSWYHADKAYFTKTPLIRWLDGKNPLGSYENFAIDLGITLENSSKERLIQAVNNQLKQYPGWLLIWDNVETCNSIREFLPNVDGLAGTILFTTQSIETLEVAQRVNITAGMSEDDATKLLQQVSGLKDLENAKKLAKKLYYLPLALMEAAVYIKYKHNRSSDFNFEDYQPFVDTLEPEIVQEQSEDRFRDQKYAQLKAVQLVIEEILEKRDRRFLTFCSLIEAQNIPKFLIESYVKQAENESNPSERSQKLTQCLSKNGLLNLIAKTDENWSMHEIVQLRLQTDLKEKMIREDQDSFDILDKILRIFDDYASLTLNKENIKQQEQLLPHVLSFFLNLTISLRDVQFSKDFASKINSFSTKWTTIINSLAIHNPSLTALDYTHKALKNAKKIYEKYSSKEELAIFLISIGMVYQDGNKFESAKSYWLDALTLLEEIYSNDEAILHDVKKSKNVISSSYQYNNQLYDIAKLLEIIVNKSKCKLLYYFKCIDIYELSSKMNFKIDLVKYLTALEEVGLIYNEMGDFQNSLMAFQKAIEVLKTSSCNYNKVYYGFLAKANYNAGTACMKLKCYQLAINYFHESLKLREEHLPDDELKKANSMQNIGSAHMKLGQYTEALYFFNQSRGIYQTNHTRPEVIKDIENYIKICNNNSNCSSPSKVF